MSRPVSTLLLSFALSLAQPMGAVAADHIAYFREGQRLDPQVVAAVLAPKTRSIRLLQDAVPAEPAVTASAETARTQPRHLAPADAPPPADVLALPVQFAFDSADILARARSQLDALADGIKLLEATQVVVIEGHTDARGTPAYNLELSRRRAESVKRYLVSEHGLDPARLKTVGYGIDRPLAGTDSAAAQNRRVQFRGA
jgi:outer membrane protein OmpA-like peptidoglycan-associated protein